MNITSRPRPINHLRPVRKERPSRVAQLAEAAGKTLSTPFLVGSIGVAFPCKLAIDGIRSRHEIPAANRQELLTRLKDDASDIAFAAAFSAVAFPLGFAAGLAWTPIVAREEFGSIQW